MNLKQLEEIVAHAEEIRELLDSNTSGTSDLNEDFERFEKTLRNELKNRVFEQYQSQKG